MKRTRKGFTLVELLIVIAIMGVLAAMMSLSVGSSTATAKAATINNNIHNIKMAALMYQVQLGDGFLETQASKANIESAKLIALGKYDSATIFYAIKEGTVAQAGTPASGTEEGGDYVPAVPAKPGTGAYVICKFNDDSDKETIANALKGYKNLRIDTTNYTVGSFLYHDTAESKGSETYDTDFTFD